MKKYVSLSKLSTFLDKLKTIFAPLSHTHKLSDLTDYSVDAALSETSTNPVQNKVLNEEFDSIATAMNALELAVDGKAATSHGTHVSYSTTAPMMDGTASAGSAATVARSDHKHPTDTSRAAKTDLDSHISNTTLHITSTERTNWNAAKNHADSAHAPSNAEKNQNAFSNIAVGSTTIAADSATDTLTLAGSNVTITPDATNDKVTIGITKDNVTAALGYTPPTTNTTYTFDGAVSTIKDNNLTASRALVSNGSGKVAVSDITSTELGYLDGVTSNVQTQLNGKAASTHNHDSAYDAKGAANTALASAKTYADSVGATVKNDLLNGAGAAYDTLKELGDLIDTNTDAIEALNTVAAGKADATHTHTIANVTGLQTTLDSKVPTTRTINGKALSANITLSASDVGADASGAANTALTSAKSYADTALSGKMDSTNPTGSGNFSFGRADGTTVGNRSIVLGSDATASGKDSVVIGRKGKSTGSYAVSIGYGNTVSGDNAVSIGVNSTASSGNSITIGSGNTASGWDAIALGRSCTASGSESTTTGMGTTSSGYASLSTGYYTEANGGAQTVLGSLNIVDDAPGENSTKSKHLVIVGNGDMDAETQTRSNAHTLDWDGNAWFAGDVYVGGSNQDNGDRLVKSSELSPITTSGTGAAYTATVDGITALTAGASFMMVPHTESTSTSPTLNVNGLGAIRIRRRLSTNTTTTTQGASNTWLSAGKPIRVTYDGIFWIADLPKTSATDLMGTVPIENGGTGVNSEADLKQLITSTAYQIGGDEPTSGPILWFETITA